MASIFTKIINGEIPCYKIAEDDNYFAFLDINPNAKGHTLCIPKKEVDKIMDLDEDSYMGLMAFSREIGKAIETSIECKMVVPDRSTVTFTSLFWILTLLLVAVVAAGVYFLLQ